jgi:CRISPR-associated endoribonuclease Cas6/Csy4 subtype I-F
MTSHYLDFRIDVPEAESGETSHLLGRLWQRVHGVLAGQNIQHVGISLPALRSHHPGNVLRLHSDETTLQQIGLNEGIGQLVEGGGILMNAVLPIPAYCQYRRYIRSRSPEKYSDAWLLRSEARLLKHLEETGGQLDVSKLLGRRKRLQERVAQRKEGDGVYIKLQSGSTRQRFSLMIRIEKVAAAQLGVFSHYGLAISRDGKTAPEAAVPWF